MVTTKLIPKGIINLDEKGLVTAAPISTNGITNVVSPSNEPPINCRYFTSVVPMNMFDRSAGSPGANLKKKQLSTPLLLLYSSIFLPFSLLLINLIICLVPKNHPI